MKSLRLFTLHFSLFALICLGIMSCSSKEDKKLSDLLFNESLNTAYLGEELFTGKAWSADGKTLCIECDNGNVYSVKAFHKNGSIAIESKTLKDEGKNFNAEGKEISTKEFVAAYPDIVKAIGNIVTAEILFSPELK